MEEIPKHLRHRLARVRHAVVAHGRVGRRAGRRIGDVRAEDVHDAARPIRAVDVIDEDVLLSDTLAGRALDRDGPHLRQARVSMARRTLQAKPGDAHVIAGVADEKRGVVSVVVERVEDLRSLMSEPSIAAQRRAGANELLRRARDLERLGVVDLDHRSPSHVERPIEILLVRDLHEARRRVLRRAKGGACDEVLGVGDFARADHERRAITRVVAGGLHDEVSRRLSSALCADEDRVAVEREALPRLAVARLQLERRAGHDDAAAHADAEVRGRERAKLDVVRGIDLANAELLRDASVARVEDDRLARRPPRLAADVDAARAERVEREVAIAQRRARADISADAIAGRSHADGELVRVTVGRFTAIRRRGARGENGGRCEEYEPVGSHGLARLQ